jgi:hypothetical protein
MDFNCVLSNIDIFIIICNYLQLKDFSRLDIALCNKKSRVYFLELCKRYKTIEIIPSIKFYHYVFTIRKIKITKFIIFTRNHINILIENFTMLEHSDIENIIIEYWVDDYLIQNMIHIFTNIKILQLGDLVSYKNILNLINKCTKLQKLYLDKHTKCDSDALFKILNSPILYINIQNNYMQFEFIYRYLHSISNNVVELQIISHKYKNILYSTCKYYIDIIDIYNNKKTFITTHTPNMNNIYILIELLNNMNAINTIKLEKWFEKFINKDTISKRLLDIIEFI